MSHPYPFFDEILVTGELMPVREAAIAGDFEAMFTLADSVLRGENTVRCSALAWMVINAMMDHPDFRKDLQRFCNVYLMGLSCCDLDYRQGRIDYGTYVTDARIYVKGMVDVMTTAPLEQWNIRQLRSCLNWLEEHDALSPVRDTR